MPRNGSGSMTAPGSYPPAAGSTISLADYKALIDDIVAELTDSLSRSGKGGMTNPLKLAEGTPAAPSLAFSAEGHTGFYKPAGVSELRAAVLGALVAKLTAAGLDVTGTLGVSGVATLGGIAGAIVDDATLELNAGKVRAKDLGIATAKIADSAVATAKIADAAVTRAKLAGVGHVASTASSGSFSTSSTSYVDVTNLSVTLTTTGRPVMLMLLSVDGIEAVLQSYRVTVGTNGGAYRFVRDGSALSAYIFSTEGSLYFDVPPPAPTLDFVGAGAHTYTVQLRALNGVCTVSATNLYLVAYEL